MTEKVLLALEGLKARRSEFEKAAALQIQVWNGEKPERQPLLLFCEPNEKDDSDFVKYNTKDTHFNSEKVFLNGFREMMMAVYGGAEAVPSIRANMGCGIFPTLFGIKQELFEDKMPWVQKHLTKEQLSLMGPEDLKIGDEFKAGLEHMAYIAEKLEGTGCRVFPLDLQGAFDTAHIVYGDAIFYDLFDDPDFIHHLLDLSCEAVFMGMEECFKTIPGSENVIAHYNSLAMPRNKGGVKISEDTSTLLSKSHIEEFVSPYLHKLLDHFSGGYVHYCGMNPHLFEAVMKEPLAYGLNFGNPEKYDMMEVLKRCAKAEKVFYGDVPMSGEPLVEYFKKCLSASSNQDKSYLLLQFICKKEERTGVIEAWNTACARR